MSAKQRQQGQHHPQGRQCPCKLLPQCLSSFTAAEYGDLHSLQSRTDVAHRVGPGGMTPLHYAAQNGHAAATALLLGLGADVDGRPNVREMSVSVLQEGWNYIEKSERAWCGATPLHRASFSGAVSSMQVLLQWNGGGGSDACNDRKQCDLLAKDTSFGDMMTPLHKAAAGGRPLAVQLLLETLRNRTYTAGASDSETKSTLRQGLMALDFQGRTPLEVAKCIDPVEEAKSVKRWDSVAGGRPNWQQCVAILQNAEREVGLDQSRSSSHDIQVLASAAAIGKTEQLPPLPKHLLDSVSCLDCGVEDGGTCLTSSWEAAFRSALSFSTNRVGNATACAITDTEGRRESRKDSTATTSDKSGPQNGRETLHRVGASVSDINTTPCSSTTSNAMIGHTCSSCGVRSLVLFRGSGGGLFARSAMEEVGEAT
eukprot:CAMPEP_0178681636 /NCGR_PEP_ID=MMETSP0699-20121125/1342_1 /TAXON_ID=265572 /ORGANISM="Extubocellulus spinifer, Strain CCMP396" /LENGTH=426 /DNA_ID=CAMNT_0020326109 /DNA_START=3444 /DNA_END=4725 /DNA_ORIENTATION=+